MQATSEEVSAAPVAADFFTREWTKAELKRAQRLGLTLTVGGGISGVITAVRDTDVVLQLPYGVAYVQVASITTLAPARYNAKTRVSTPYGRGVVKEFRLTEEGHADYVITLVDFKLSPSEADVEAAKAATGSAALLPATGYATAYVRAEEVKFRHKRTITEALTDADFIRTLGNNAYQAGNFEQAIEMYQKSIECVTSIQSPLTPSERRAFLDACVRTLGNCAQASLSMTPPRYQDVIRTTSDALELDSDNSTGSAAKNLLRRAKAFRGLQLYSEALADLGMPAIASSAEAQNLQREIRAIVKDQEAKEKKMWGKAFAKNSKSVVTTDAEGAAAISTKGGPAAPAASTTAPAAKSVHFSGVTSAPAPPAVVAATEASPVSAATSKRLLNAGATPHASRVDKAVLRDADEAAELGSTKKTVIGAGGTALTLLDEEEEEGSSSSGLSSWLPKAAGAVAVAGIVALGAVYLTRKR